MTRSSKSAFLILPAPRFTYNVGSGAFASSTLLKKLNAGDVPGACKELQRWTYAGGKQWKGLITRREIEREVCEWGQK